MIQVGKRYKLKHYKSCQIVTDPLRINSLEPEDNWKKIEIEIKEMNKEGMITRCTGHYNNQSSSCSNGCIQSSDLIHDDTLKSSTNNIFMDVLAKIKSALRTEPEKSLIKAGLMNESENLTVEGKEVLLDIIKDEYKTQLKEKADIIIKLSEKETK